MNPFLLLVLAYLLGSIPTSYWVGRAAHGVDLRTEGSGNLGATNALRVLGWRSAVPVAVFDVLKGWAPVVLFPLAQRPDDPAWALAYGGAAIVGHVFSVWVRFRGGKGVATSAGVFFGLAPWAATFALVVWAVAVLTTRIVSVGSILAALALPVGVWLLPTTLGRGDVPLLVFTVALSLFVLWAHRGNIRRLARGREHRFGQAPGTGPEPGPAPGSPASAEQGAAGGPGEDPSASGPEARSAPEPTERG